MTFDFLISILGHHQSTRGCGQAEISEPIGCFEGKQKLAGNTPYQLDSLILDFVGDEIVPRSVLEAIKDGHWDFEPEKTETASYASTKALPGTDEKLEILANRVRRGLPLWHPSDRRTYDDREID